jgi:hypothetical protein
MDLEGSNCGLIRALPQNLPGKTEENLRRTSHNTDCVPAENRIEYLLNVRLERYRYVFTSIYVL